MNRTMDGTSSPFQSSKYKQNTTSNREVISSFLNENTFETDLR